MTVFQFDECSSCNSFIRRCNKEGLAIARKFKDKHRSKGIKDPQMLKMYLALGGVLVTFDNDMIDDHTQHIPEKSPGIIIIEHSPDMPYTLTQKSVEKIIKAFKEKFPNWHVVQWANSIVRITEKSVAVCQKTSTEVRYNCWIELSDTECEKQVTEHLSKNAAS